MLASCTFVPSQVLHSLFVASIPAAPGSYRSPSPTLPTMPWLLSSPQPDLVSLGKESVPSVFFSPPSLPYASSCQLAFDQSLRLPRLGAGGGGVCKTAEDTPGSCFQFRHLELHQGCFQLPCIEKQDWQEYNVLTEDRIPRHFLSNTIVKVDLQFKFGQQK